MKPHEKLGVAIANAGYDWTPEMRSAWEELDKTIARLEKELEEANDVLDTIDCGSLNDNT